MFRRLFLIILAMALLTVVQGQSIESKKCKTCGKPMNECQYKGRHPQKKYTQQELSDIIDKGDRYYDAWNVKKAAEQYKIAADQGYARAQYKYGWLYTGDNGKGPWPKDRQIAEKWFRKAANQGYHPAIYHIGRLYMDDEDYVEAESWFRKAAENGSPYASYAIGEIYEYGRGNYPRDYTEARKWYMIASERGHCHARINLGDMYRDGRGVTKYYKEAVNWYRMATQDSIQWRQAYEWASYRLGELYESGGFGLAQNYTEAAHWYHISSMSGDYAAQERLGTLYFYGRGVPQDYNEAIRWYRMSAEQEWHRAMYNMGLMYQYGYGVKKDIEEARRWYQKAVDETGNEEAKKKLQELEKIQ